MRGHSADLQRLSAQLITAQEEERRTIARELHDEVGQALTAIKVELAVAQRTIEAAGGAGALVAPRARSPKARCTRSAICPTCCTRPCSTTSACRRPIDGYVREFGKRHGIRVEFCTEQHGRAAPAEPKPPPTASSRRR